MSYLEWLSLDAALSEVMQRLPLLVRYETREAQLVEVRGKRYPTPASVTFYADKRSISIPFSAKLPQRIAPHSVDGIVDTVDKWLRGVE